MVINTTVTLNEFEIELCKIVARKKHNNNRRSNIKNSKRGPQSDGFTDLEGFAAELAFCKLFNIYPDFSIDNKSSISGTDIGDAVLPTGQIVDVKATRYKTGKLAVVPWKKVSGDLFALMVGTIPTYTFKGFARQDDLIQEKRKGSLIPGQISYIMEQSELNNLEDL